MESRSNNFKAQANVEEIDVVSFSRVVEHPNLKEALKEVTLEEPSGRKTSSDPSA